ncbi:MAG TPA: signal peptidase I [Actinomycetota bacterium]|nr:signal peptidase I [Actinomycetota bacterium]
MSQARPPAGASAGDVRTPVEPVATPVEPQPTEAEKKSDQDGGIFGFFKELPGLIIIAFALALLIKTFLIQAFFIPSGSMVPTLRVGDRVLVNKLVYDFGEPQRGDVIVFENPTLREEDRNVFQAVWDWLVEGFGFSADPTRDFIKRVVGVPGDTVEMKNGKVYVNGKLTSEPYLSNRGAQDYPPTQVKPDHVFVMGDNRPNSQDSRSALGQIPMDKIVGKAFVLLWPLDRVEWLSDD